MTHGSVLGALESALVERYGQAPSRASVSFVGVDPIEVLRFEADAGEYVYATLGMSRYPMTGADEATLSSDGPRAELALRVRDPDGTFVDVWRSLAVLAAAPAVEGVVYSPGVSSDLGRALAPGSTCSGVLIGDTEFEAVATPGGAVDVFAVLPATRAELAWCRARGSTQLRTRWSSAGTDLLDLTRRPVELE